MTVGPRAESPIGPAPDRHEVVRVVRLTTDGFGAHRADVFQEAFHPSAQTYWTDAAEELPAALIVRPDADPADPNEWPNLPWQVSARIISVIQAGDVASIVLGFDVNNDPELSWLDVQSPHRVDGTRKIMSKTATYASRVDWAEFGARPGSRG